MRPTSFNSSRSSAATATFFWQRRSRSKTYFPLSAVKPLLAWGGVEGGRRSGIGDHPCMTSAKFSPFPFVRIFSQPALLASLVCLSCTPAPPPVRTSLTENPLEEAKYEMCACNLNIFSRNNLKKRRHSSARPSYLQPPPPRKKRTDVPALYNHLCAARPLPRGGAAQMAGNPPSLHSSSSRAGNSLAHFIPELSVSPPSPSRSIRDIRVDTLNEDEEASLLLDL